MGIDSTSSVIAHTNTTTFNAWMNEIASELITVCGLRRLSSSMDSGQMAFPSTAAYSATTNSAAGYYMCCFTDPLALGPLNTVALSALTAGTGYNGGASGTFNAVPLTGGLGSGAKATVVLASGVVSSITISTPGTGYSIGDQLTVTSANMVSVGAAAGGGSSASAFVASLAASVAPVVMKIEFGTGTNATGPQMYITVGTSWASNGNVGALTCGAVSTRGCLYSGAVPAGTTTPYVSRFNYNNTLGYLCFASKIGAGPNVNVAMGNVWVFRSNDSSGNPTGESISIILNNFTATGTTNGTTAGAQANMIYATNAMTTNTAPSNWLASLGQPLPFNDSVSVISGNAFMIPGYYKKPALSFMAYFGAALLTEIPVGVSVSAAMVGSTPLTWIQIGGPFGVSGVGGNSSGSVGCMMLWQ